MRRNLTVLAAIGATTSLLITTAGISAATPGSGSAGIAALSGSHSAFATAANLRGHVEATRPVSFDIVLSQRNQRQLAAMEQAVANPASPQYRHYLTRDQYVALFAPSAATVRSVSSWLRSQGFKIGDVPTNGAYVEAAGTAAQAERAFKTTLNDYAVNGRQIRAAATDLTVPASLASAVAGVSGLDATTSEPAIVRNGRQDFGVAAPAKGTPLPPPPGFENGPPCSTAWGTIPATGLPAYGQYPNPLPMAPCGYNPVQIRAAYGIDKAVAAGVDGSGQTVSIVDAFENATLESDLAAYASINDREHPLRTGQLKILTPPAFTNQVPCNAPSWSSEMTLDVEVTHSVAPGAKIVFSAAASCLNKDLNNAVNKVVDGVLAQTVSNSYGGQGENVSPGDLAAANRTFGQALMTGIGIYFSSGDSGDEFFRLGMASPDFPASHPLVTAVGGTSLGLSETGKRIFATGWQTGKSSLVNGAWSPGPPGNYLYGSGGGTSRMFHQPGYQKGVVPDSLATANGGPGKWRVVPDVAALGDVTTGFLIGFTQVFANGTYYSQSKIGGTSLSCPLFAAVMALADQHAGFHHGFANPVLYQFAGTSAYTDITAPSSLLAAVRHDYTVPNDQTSPLVTSARTIYFQGTEVGPNGSAPISLHATPGYDNMTGVGEPNGQAFLNALG